MLDELEIKEPLPSYSPTLYRITGGKGEAVALAQLIYKCSKSNWGTVRMSSTDWANELGITRNEFENLNDCINLLELGTAIKCQIGTIKKIAYTLNEQAIKEALKNPHVEYSVCRKQRINTLNSTYQHVENNVSISTEQRINTHKTAHIKDIKTIKSKEDIKEPLNETSSFGAFGLKTDLLKQVMAENIERGEAAKPKSKKPKAELSEQDKQIDLKIKDVASRFKTWYLSHKKIVYPYKRHDFVNLTTMFRDLCNNNGYTPEMVVADISKIVNGYSKLSTFNQNNFSLNLIATKYNVLLSEIDNYKPPVERKNFNEPVATVVKRDGRETFNGTWLPLGITKDQYLRLSIAIAQDKIMSGDLPEDYSAYRYADYLHTEIKDYTPDQLKTLLEEYDVR